jgi:hypothetical protein
MIAIRDLDREDICGYLGNNLFQVACGYSLAFKNNDELVIPIDWKYKDIFQDRFFECETKEGFSKRITSEYNEPHFHYKEIPYQMDMNLNGYFQSFRYFEGVDVQSLFKPNSNLRKTILESVNGDLGETYDQILSYHRVTSMHIRRADYLNLPNHFMNVSESDYYAKAIDMLSGVTDYFLIFSNDIPWCRKKFQGKKFIFSETSQERPMGNMSGPFDLFLGSMCKNHIIANSSFSWWQGFLNDSPYKKVVIPKAWFGPALPNDTSGLYPYKWIKI